MPPEPSTNPSSNDPDMKGLERFIHNLERPVFQVIPASKNNVSLTRSLIMLVLLGLLGAALYFLLRPIFMPKPLPPVYTRMEGIKRIQELHLVKLHYESIIPITEIKKTNRDGEPKKEELKFLLVAPMHLSLYVNLGQMQMDIKSDSLVEIMIPDPELSDIYVNFREVKEYSLSDRDWKLGDIKLGFSYAKVYRDIVKKIDQAKVQVRSRASSKKVLQDGRAKAEGYLRNLINGMGYRVEFIPPDPKKESENRIRLQSRMQELLENQEIDVDELRDRMGKIIGGK